VAVKVFTVPSKNTSLIIVEWIVLLLRT